MSLIEIVLAVVLGLAVNETSDLSPWLARKLMRFAARRRYADAERRQIRSDEWVALVDERPGKLFKLLTASWFAGTALCVAGGRGATRRARAITRPAATDRSRAGLGAATVTLTADQPEIHQAGELAAAWIRDLDASAGAVVSVRGPWGTGKSSVVGRAREATTTAHVVEFNPWLTSGNPASHAAAALPARLCESSRRLRVPAAAFQHYLAVLGTRSPLPGRLNPTLMRATRRLRRTLTALSRPLVIVIDDLDRMLPDEVRELFDLVARTAHLPQLIYVLSFDRHLIEPMISQADGRRNRRLQQYALDLTVTRRTRRTKAP